MLFLTLEIPTATWRKPGSTLFIESVKPIPNLSTCYGFLLSLIGEENPLIHRGAALTVGVIKAGRSNIILTKRHKYKDPNENFGEGRNISLCQKEILLGNELFLVLDHGKQDVSFSLETKVRKLAENNWEGSHRFGSLYLGESTNIVNSVDVVSEIPEGCSILLNRNSNRNFENEYSIFSTVIWPGYRSSSEEHNTFAHKKVAYGILEKNVKTINQDDLFIIE
ncbi:MAG: hypothetical protein NZZ41_04770 [Candidatus Dojkabacteria bacterium]|nr:hypothetical protein [Candidatus Dojkabacteria bacterium]